MFKQSVKTSPGPAQTCVAARLFGTPSAAAETFIKDITGYSAKPVPGTDHIEPWNRIYYRDYELLHSLLHGKSLACLTKTFHNAILKRFDYLPVTEVWMELPGLFNFLTTHVSPATIEAFVGPSLTEVIDLNFVRNFWEFDGWYPAWRKTLLSSGHQLGFTSGISY